MRTVLGPLGPFGVMQSHRLVPGGPPRTYGTPRGAPRAKTGPFGVPWGPEEARYQAKVCDNHNSNPVRPIGSSWDQIWSPGVLRGPLGPPKGALWAKKGPFRVPGGPEEARYQAKVCANHISSPVRPIGSSWDQIRPLWGAQKLFSQLGSV